MSIDKIKIINARMHNLKSISLELPRNKFIVITGPSGSGKSSLAFDTIYVEGQRRYIESLSSYARQFLDQFQPPDVESIVGLSPSIAIDQKSGSKNPRSTVGTTTEIYDYMRVLFARVGTPHCPNCNNPIEAQSASQILKAILSFPQGSKIQLLAPIVRNRKGEHKEALAKFSAMGFSRIRLDGKLVDFDDDLKINKNTVHNIEVIVDRIVLKEGVEKRLGDSIEFALKTASGCLIALVNDKEIYYSEKNFCPNCEISFPELNPRSFSFNSPLGACENCNGLGEVRDFSLKKLIFDPSLSISEGAIPVLSKKNSFLMNMVENIATQEGVNLNRPYSSLSEDFKKVLIKGSDKIYKFSFRSENSKFEFKKNFSGILEWLNKKYIETTSERTKKDLDEYMDVEVCKSCHGQRLNQFALSTKIASSNIIELSNLTVKEAHDFFVHLKLEGEKEIISQKLKKEISSRLRFLLDVGLEYLTLNRASNSLSGGENQRIRLATQIGSALSGVLYVLDEPSIGLHQRDNFRLIKTLLGLKELGNTVIVVEHDEETILNADHIVDMGPGAGVHGGLIMAEGTPAEIIKNKNSLTGKFLSHVEKIPVPQKRRVLKNQIKLTGCNENNVHNLTVEIPLGGLICVSGVSGSGKSTLIHEILVPAIKTRLSSAHSILYKRDNVKSVTGIDHIQSIIELDQSPIGRTPHSNPATYTGLFDDIRNLFSKTPESQIRGYKSGRFSFNVKGGRCEGCEGNGIKKIEMHFLPDVYITCTECNGKRYNKETLSIEYRGKNIADVLDLSIEEAKDYFKNHSKIFRALETMDRVGLGYMKLGQSATTLSGGEAQRLKLSRELSKRTKGHCLYVLDEPTTGLHFRDIKILISALELLIEQGHTVLVIEHNMDIIKMADYIIDMGPEGGVGGGTVVAKGTPEEVSKTAKSYTGKFLKEVLENKKGHK